MSTVDEAVVRVVSGVNPMAMWEISLFYRVKHLVCAMH